jgi:branched-chain amino acid transport system ATP-binding protein
VLEVAGLRAGYGPIEVLHGIDLTVGAEEIVVVLGANGAGKTTTMRAISGTIARQGAVRMEGVATERLSADSVVRLGIALVPQGRGTFSDLTVEENLRVGAYVRSDGGVDSDIDQWYGVFPRLRERSSGGSGEAREAEDHEGEVIPACIVDFRGGLPIDCEKLRQKLELIRLGCVERNLAVECEMQ